MQFGGSIDLLDALERYSVIFSHIGLVTHQLLIVVTSTAEIFSLQKRKSFFEENTVLGGGGPSGGDSSGLSNWQPPTRTNLEPRIGPEPVPGPSQKTEEQGREDGGARSRAERCVAFHPWPSTSPSPVRRFARSRCTSIRLTTRATKIKEKETVRREKKCIN